MSTGRTHTGMIVAALALASCRPGDKAAPDHWNDAPAPAPAPYPLGENCDPAKRKAAPEGVDAGGMVRTPREECGRDGRVSVVTFFSYSFPRPPAAVQRNSNVGPAFVWVEGSRVSIDSDCLICRTDSRRLYVADLTRVTDEQKVELQRVAGLPDAPLLADGEAWRKALSKS